jgi:hypothetical protein
MVVQFARLSGYTRMMAKSDEIAINLRIVIEQPVIGVLHSLQAKDDAPLDPKSSHAGEPLHFDVPVRVAPGPRFLGDQVRREGSKRRFVYIRIGQLAGDPSSPWSRRMKIDIHDIDPALLEGVPGPGGVIETTVVGTGKDGTPACATVAPIRRRLIARKQS